MDNTELLRRARSIKPVDINIDVLVKDIKETFDIDLQGNMTISMEECAELIKEISKTKKVLSLQEPYHFSTLGLHEEIADVAFCIIGLITALELDTDLIMSILRVKTDRSIERRNNNG